MRKRKINLKITDVRKLKVGDRSKIKEPLFWRNDIVSAWCIADGIVEYPSLEYGLGYKYNEYWLGIYDENCNRENKIDFSFSSYDSRVNGKFKLFYDCNEIKDEIDLKIQKMFLTKVNYLIDKGILIMEE